MEKLALELDSSKSYRIYELIIDLFFHVDKLSVFKLSVKKFDNFLNKVSIKNNETLKYLAISSILLNFSFFNNSDYNDKMKSSLKILINELIMHMIEYGSNYDDNWNTKDNSLEVRIQKFEKHKKSLKILENIDKKDRLLRTLFKTNNDILKYKSLFKIKLMIDNLLKNITQYSTPEILKFVYETILFNIISQDIPNNRNKFNKTLKNQPYSLIPKSPYLPMNNNYKYSLVVDLDETLIHNLRTDQGNFFLVRPGTLDFLKKISQFYEIIIFTASAEDYANEILDKLDSNGIYIKHRLFRKHTSFNPDRKTFKDLSKLGRDLSKVIMIDNNSENFRYQKENGITIITWENDVFDNELEKLSTILIDIFLSDCDDVREKLNKY